MNNGIQKSMQKQMPAKMDAWQNECKINTKNGWGVEAGSPCGSLEQRARKTLGPNILIVFFFTRISI
jgi:hypothetical protein